MAAKMKSGKTSRPNPKRYPGKHSPEISVKRNFATVQSGEFTIGAFHLIENVGIIPCGCARCRKAQAADDEEYGYPHDLIIIPKMDKESPLHLGGGLTAFRREIKRRYTSLAKSAELRGLKLRDRPERKSTPKKKSASKKSGKKATQKKSTRKRSAAKKNSQKKGKRTARKPATRKK